jgi:hypothetical protein
MKKDEGSPFKEEGKMKEKEKGVGPNSLEKARGMHDLIRSR